MAAVASWGCCDVWAEESKVLVNRLYEEVCNRGAYRVAKEIKLYGWRRELVQRGLSMAHRELHPLALHLRRGVVTWPSLAKARKVETYFAPTWLTRRALRAVIADSEERSRWSKRLKELLETRDVLQALNAFDPVANRRLGGSGTTGTG